jgi:chemotaxis protein MotB
MTTSRARRPIRTHHGPSRDRWLVSYADFITLLFAFFATMYAISSVDARKLSSVAQALQQAFDDPAGRKRPDGGNGVLPADASLTAGPRERSTADIEEAVNRDLAEELASERLELIVDRRGVTLSIPEAGAFAVGRDELSTTAQELVARIAATLDRFGNAIRVEGHTDDVPIHNVRFVSNWDLSAARACRVVEFLIARGLEAQRLSATGYVEFHPRVPNTSPESRAANRRIDLVILNATTTTAEEPAPAATTR